MKIESNKDELKELRYLTRAMYGRFYIPEYFMGGGKVIYTDVDVVFLDDIAKLYAEDLNGYSLAACYEDFNEWNHINERRNLQLGIDKNHKYFSSGLLIIDVDKWRELNVLNSLISLHNLLKSKLQCPDQDLLNVYFGNRYKPLDSKYVVINQRLNIFLKDGKLDNCFIRHFNGPIKPWHYKESIADSFVPGSCYFWICAKETPFYTILDRSAKLEKITGKKNILSRIVRKVKSILRK